MAYLRLFLFVVSILAAYTEMVYAYDFGQNGLYYTVTGDSRCIVTSTPPEVQAYEGEINIPPKVSNRGEAFDVVGIDTDAFKDCNNLTALTIPASVDTIYLGAFTGCNGLKTLTLEDGEKEIFISYMNFNPSYAIYTPAFKDSPLENVYVGRNVVYSGWMETISPFSKNTAIKYVEIGKSVTTIKPGLFSGCVALESIRGGESVREIGGWAFSECGLMDGFTLGDNITTIGQYAFYGCNSLKTLSITGQKPISTIGISAFCGVQFQEDIHLAYLEHVDLSMFSECSLNNLIIGEKAQSVVGSLSDFATIEALLIEDGEDELNWSAPSNYRMSETPIDSLYVGRNIVSDTYYRSPLCHMKKLRAVEIGDKVTDLPIDFLYGSDNLSVVKGGKNLVNISNRAFCDCSQLSSFEFAPSIEQIEEYAFFRTSLTGNIVLNKCYNVGNAAFSCTQIERIKLPAIETLGYSVFEECAHLNTIDLGSELKDMGKECFKNCVELETLTLPDGLETLAQGMCYGCTSLTIVNLGDNIKSIQRDAFNGCPLQFERLVIRPEVNEIGQSAFSCVKKIEQLVFADSKTPITINKSYRNNMYTTWIPYDTEIKYVYMGRNISGQQFGGMNSITEVVVGDSVTEIKSNMFLNCKNIETLKLGKSLETIRYMAFSGCRGLDGSQLVLPSSLITMEANVFKDVRFSQVESLADVPPTITSSSFSSYTTASAPLYVPKGSVNEYMADEYWSTFKTILPILDQEDAIDERTVISNAMDHIFDLQGRELTTPKRGINIIGNRKVLIR